MYDKERELHPHGVGKHHSLACGTSFTSRLFVFSAPHRTASQRTPPHPNVEHILQVLGDGSNLGTFTSSGTTVDFENWTINAADVSTIKLVARDLGYNDWLSITEARAFLGPWS